ncbi:S1 RNA-binding domain-containing protein [Limosilactobacillus gastricus]|uniref:Transcription accessory protein n=1 Tax=Limosilactobacillus gastricus DSM 16045 TaxID=1423749 RepID=A0A0R1V735_9LACO|nr:Tex family protein [Limosilactobacillus gastricus]KRM01341.1 Transcription accessory protein [Limosilactobacillus gastricus DSM 16045]QGF40949.1 S1 RNA-binding domain-containing protein [Limosilactobacillus gastricus]
MEATIVKNVEATLTEFKPWQVKAALELMDEGNTIPFISRYRKEATGTLDEVQLQTIQTTYHKAQELADRKQTVLKAIADQDKLTDALKHQIEAAPDLPTVEDLYLPYKQKRRTKAQIAKEQGLMPLANWLLHYEDTGLITKAAEFVTDEVADAPTALSGAHEILAEAISEMSTVRAWLRDYTTKNGRVVTKVTKQGATIDEKGVYQQYYDFDAAIKDMTSYRTLAINRGEKEKVLRVKIEVASEPIENYLAFRLIRGHAENDATRFVMAAAQDAYKRFLGPAIERELRHQMTEEADEQAINVFGENLYHLLMQAPIKGKMVLGFDPAYRTGCKLAVLDPSGKLIQTAVIYPHPPAPEAKRAQAQQAFLDLINQYQIEMVAIGNGTASRESEQFVATALKQLDRDVYYVIVNESGASVYSASQDARDEFPDLTVEKRSAISIGRRLQDPLAELVKIDPQAIGVGQYQHDLPETELKTELTAMVERAVNRVGVNLNTASYQLLTYISGLSATIAKNIVKYRDENGQYVDRTQLKKVSRLGPKAYQQAVGFLRIVDGDNPLDNTDIHPESYPVATQILQDAQVTVSELGSSSANQALQALDPQTYVTDTVGLATVTDVINDLQKPGRDLRDSMPAPLLHQDVMTIDDLKVGMQLEGTVRNVVDFGAFVDIGVKHDGLVHVSRMSKKFIKDPRQVVSVGDIVTVWVYEVDLDRQRIQLTMLPPKNDHDKPRVTGLH